jgi:hypothetical protein
VVSMVYGIAGASFSNTSALKAAGFIDFHLVVYATNDPGTSFVNTCHSLGVSPILNNGNDGCWGWGGGSGNCPGQMGNSSSYYPALASEGWMAAGGESEMGNEDAAIQANMIFMNYGGEGTGGAGCGNNDIYGGYAHATVSGKGTASYLESYTSSSMISASCMASAAVACKNAGCKEVGIMIGPWAGADYGADENTYIAMVDAFASSGVTCAGFVVWNGHGTDANANYNEVESVIRALQTKYPANMTTIDKRFGGVSPTPTPTPTPVGSASGLCKLTANIRVQEYQPKTI